MAAALFARRIRSRVLPTAISTKTSPKHEFVGHQGDVRSFVFLQDNVHFVSGSRDGTLCKWDCETGLLVGEPWKVGNPVYALALSPDGRTIACGKRDGSVQRWDTNGQMMEGIWTGHSSWVQVLSWSPSGRHLASGSSDGTILIRKAGSGEVEVGPINANQGWVESVAYSNIHLRVTKLHRAGPTFPSGTVTLASFLSARSKPMCFLLCGHWMAANCTLVATIHVFSTAPQAQNSIASSMTISRFPSHFHPNTIYSQAWVGMVLHNYGTRNHISHLASHFICETANTFTACHFLLMGDTWRIVGQVGKLR